MTRRNFTLFFELHSTCTYIYNNHLYLEANKVDLHFPWCWGVWLGPSCPHPRWVLYRQDQRCICPGRGSEWDSGQTLEKAPLMIYSPPKTAKTRSLRVMKDKWAILGYFRVWTMHQMQLSNSPLCPWFVLVQWWPQTCPHSPPCTECCVEYRGVQLPYCKAQKRVILHQIQ